MSTNVLYSPEKFGLTPIASVEWSAGCYEFDTTMFWKDAQGRILSAHDAGCSCPIPFEAIGVDDMTVFATGQEAAAYLQKERKDHNYVTNDEIDMEIADAIAKLVA